MWHNINLKLLYKHNWLLKNTPDGKCWRQSAHAWNQLKSHKDGVATVFPHETSPVQSLLTNSYHENTRLRYSTKWNSNFDVIANIIQTN